MSETTGVLAMANNPTAKRRGGAQGPAGDVAAAAGLLAENLTLLAGRAPTEAQLLPGKSHLHRVSLYWSPREPGSRAVCLQVRATSATAAPNPHGPVAPGWSAAEAQAVAESLDLRLHEETIKRSFGDFRAWRRATGPGYYFVLVDQSDPPLDKTVLDQRCAALEAGYLDGAAWLRFYSGRQFAEGSFTRLMQHLAHDVRAPVTNGSPPAAPPAPPRGLC